MPLKNCHVWNFPRGPVVKNRPSNVGDVGSIPGQGTKIQHAGGATKPTHCDYSLYTATMEAHDAARESLCTTVKTRIAKKQQQNTQPCVYFNMYRGKSSFHKLHFPFKNKCI